MTKIIIISCIVAVCVLQTAKAGIFDRLTPNLRIPDLLEKGKEREKEVIDRIGKEREAVENRAKELHEQALDIFGNASETLLNYVQGLLTDVPTKLKNVTDGIRTALQSPSCTNLSTLVENAGNEVKSRFISCAVNVTQSTNIRQNIEQLFDATNNLKTNVSKIVENLSNCTRNSNLINCLSKLPQEISKVSPGLYDVVMEARTLRSILPNLGANVGACYPQAISEVLSQNSSEIILNGQECFKNITQAAEDGVRDIMQYIQRFIQPLLS